MHVCMCEYYSHTFRTDPQHKCWRDSNQQVHFLMCKCNNWSGNVYMLMRREEEVREILGYLHSILYVHDFLTFCLFHLHYKKISIHGILYLMQRNLILSACNGVLSLGVWHWVDTVAVYLFCSLWTISMATTEERKLILCGWIQNMHFKKP